MIKEQFIEYETAKLLKMAGFNELCRYAYYTTGLVSAMHERNCKLSPGYVSRPTQSVAARWLREKKGLHVYAIQTNLPLTEPQTTEWEWGYVVTKVDDPNGRDNFIDMYYTSYEEAMEAGIRHALELVIDKMDGERATGEGHDEGSSDL